MKKQKKNIYTNIKKEKNKKVKTIKNTNKKTT